MTLARNSLLNLLPTVVGVVVSLVTVPLYIANVGSDRYGAILIAWVLLGYFGQADFGLGRAVTQRLSSSPGATPLERASIVWSALAGAGLISALGAGVVFFAAKVFFTSYFEAGVSLKAEAIDAAWLFAICVPVIMMTGVSSGALAGLERFGIVAAGTLTGNVLSQILPLGVAMYHSVDLEWLLGASVAGRAIGLMPVMVSMWWTFLRDLPFNPAIAQLRRLFTYGVWIMVTAIVGPLMTMSDRLAIGATIGAVAVVVYSVPFQIASRTVMLPNSIMQALFPRFASQTIDQARELGRQAMLVVGQLYAFVVLGLICLAAPLLELWLGDALDGRSILVGQIALIGFWMNAIANVPYAILQAQGNSRFTAILHVVELPLYFVMLYGFGVSVGLYGIALAFTLRASLDCVVLVIKAEIVDLPLLGRLLGPALILISGLVASQWLDEWLWAIAGATMLSLVLALVCWIQMPESLKGRLATRLVT
jgi:Membrane protein involved in the export of O-antigen and teichoic acid